MNICRMGTFAAKIGVHKNTVKAWDRYQRQLQQAVTDS